MQDFIKDIFPLNHDPLISEKNERIMKDITAIKRTSQFEKFDLSEEEIDELLVDLNCQEDYLNEMDNIIKDLKEIPNIPSYAIENDYI